jgi:hypothetical protein
VSRIAVVSFRPFSRDFELLEVHKPLVHAAVVHVYDFFALAAVSVNDRVLEILDRVVYRNNIGELEEYRLKDHVYAEAAFIYASRYADAVDGVELDFFIGEVAFHFGGESLAAFFDVPRAVENERAAFFHVAGHVVFIDVRRGVAGYVVGVRNVICRFYGLVAEAQV